jgi:hypothetical protein
MQKRGASSDMAYIGCRYRDCSTWGCQTFLSRKLIKIGELPLPASKKLSLSPQFRRSLYNYAELSKYLTNFSISPQQPHIHTP